MLISHKPSHGEKVEDPHGHVTFRLVLGAALFGAGWGIGGLCPGPYLLAIPNSLKLAFYWGVPFFLAQKSTHLLVGDAKRHHHNPKDEKRD